MKSIIEIFCKTPQITRKMMLIFITFSLSILIVSAAAFYLAEQTNAYYCAKELSFELITALRSCSTILAAGAVIAAYLEKDNK